MKTGIILKTAVGKYIANYSTDAGYLTDNVKYAFIFEHEKEIDVYRGKEIKDLTDEHFPIQIINIIYR